MFRNDRLVKPGNRSVLGALAVAVAVFLFSQVSAFAGYLVGVSALLIMIVAMMMSSIWPTRGKKENSIVFSLFWGLMIGGIVPFVISVYLEGGISAVFEIFAS